MDIADESIRVATDRAIAAATHLTNMDVGAVAVLRKLADAADYLLAHDGLSVAGKFDNVTVPTYLRYCEQLGLTPAGRKALAEKKPEGTSGKLGQLRAVHGRTA